MTTSLASLLLATLAAGFLTEPTKPPPFATVVASSFSRWDRDKNGELSLNEVNRALVDPAVKGPEAAAAAALRRGMKATKGGPSKLTTAELSAPRPQKEAVKEKAASAQQKTAAPPNWGSLYHSSYQRLAKATRELYGSGKPSIDKLRQGKLGDCYCIAPLGAVCFRNPDDVVKMITPNKDGTFGVRIGKEVVVVSAPTDGELALSGSTGGQGMWVNVYEKAVGEWRRQRGKDQSAVALDLLGKGGSAGSMLAALTGQKVERYSLSAFKSETFSGDKREAKLKELRGRLDRAFAEGRLVTTGTGGLKTKPPGINGRHAYAVLGYDKATDQLLVWNPHGQTFKPKGPDGWEHGYTTAGGKFRIPLADFVRLFGGLAFEVGPAN